MSKGIPDHVKPFFDKHVHHLFCSDEVRDYHNIVCSYCKIPIRSGMSYACLPCKFGVHVKCPDEVNVQARLSIMLPKSKIFDKTEVKSLHLKSEELVPCRSNQTCLSCGKPCAATIYCDCSGGFRIHESCSLLPAEIQHPFHSHQLVLGFPSPPLRHPSLHPPENCYACKTRLRQFSWNQLQQVYRCTLCNDFYMHIECAQQMPLIRHSAHKHPLILVRIKRPPVVVPGQNDIIHCNWCSCASPEEEGDEYGVYRCVPCDFSIHESCAKYPKYIVNVEQHHHRLQYILPPDDEAIDIDGDKYEWSSDDYCETCGKDILQNHPIFKCMECPTEFLFHRDCALVASKDAYQEDSRLLFQELCEEFGKGNCNAPLPALMLPVERMCETMGMIETLTLELEEEIRKLVNLSSG